MAERGDVDGVCGARCVMVCVFVKHQQKVKMKLNKKEKQKGLA